jgi:hypothetical protein
MTINRENLKSKRLFSEPVSRIRTWLNQKAFRGLRTITGSENIARTLASPREIIIRNPHLERNFEEGSIIYAPYGVKAIGNRLTVYSKGNTEITGNHNTVYSDGNLRLIGDFNECISKDSALIDGDINRVTAQKNIELVGGCSYLNRLYAGQNITTNYTHGFDNVLEAKVSAELNGNISDKIYAPKITINGGSGVQIQKDLYSVSENLEATQIIINNGHHHKLQGSFKKIDLSLNQSDDFKLNNYESNSRLNISAKNCKSLELRTQGEIDGSLEHCDYSFVNAQTGSVIVTNSVETNVYIKKPKIEIFKNLEEIILSLENHLKENLIPRQIENLKDFYRNLFLMKFYFQDLKSIKGSSQKEKEIKILNAKLKELLPKLETYMEYPPEILDEELRSLMSLKAFMDNHELLIASDDLSPQDIVEIAKLANESGELSPKTGYRVIVGLDADNKQKFGFESGFYKEKSFYTKTLQDLQNEFGEEYGDDKFRDQNLAAEVLDNFLDKVKDYFSKSKKITANWSISIKKKFLVSSPLSSF